MFTSTVNSSMTILNSFLSKKASWLSNMPISKEFKEFQQLWEQKLYQPSTTPNDLKKSSAPVILLKKSLSERTKSSSSQDANEMKLAPSSSEDPVSTFLMKPKGLFMTLCVCWYKQSRTNRSSMEVEMLKFSWQ